MSFKACQTIKNGNISKSFYEYSIILILTNRDVCKNCSSIPLINWHVKFLSKIIAMFIIKLLVWELKDAPTKNLSDILYHSFKKKILGLLNAGGVI